MFWKRGKDKENLIDKKGLKQANHAEWRNINEREMNDIRGSEGEGQ